jgi:hypothetical protein
MRVTPAMRDAAHGLVRKGLVRFERGGMVITSEGVEAHRASSEAA